jgi:radical SAM protein (TIGR01212 family)
MESIHYPWHHQKRYNSYSEYFKREFGGRIQKVAIDAGFSCPNRDGTRAYGGCTYCNNDAFNPSYCQPEKSIAQQISEGIEFHQVRYRRAKNYLAYFQAFSNTHAPIDKLRRLYDEALSYPGVIGLVIGTRPDCIDDLKLEYFAGLAEKYYIILEYGIESCYNKTLLRINRHHTFEESVVALEKTSSMGIRTGAHIIFGLPGESREDMLAEAKILSDLPINSLKFHQLQIIKGSQMALEYHQIPDDFNLFTLEEYIDFIIRFIERLNPAFVIERFTGEAPPRFLEVPGWNGLRTDQVTNLIEKQIEMMNTWQGRLYI